VGKLHITIHHNFYRNVGQRAPRVRFGQVDVYNSLYQVTDPDVYAYNWGVGVQSAIVAQHNAFELPDGVDPAKIIKYWKGTAITASHNIVNGAVVDLLSAYNSANVDQLGADAGWTPALRTTVHAPTQLARVLGDLAGAGRAGREETITVDPSGDFPTVQAAVDAAPSGSLYKSAAFTAQPAVKLTL
jgi:pectate lyase